MKFTKQIIAIALVLCLSVNALDMESTFQAAMQEFRKANPTATREQQENLWIQLHNSASNLRRQDPDGPAPVAETEAKAEPVPIMIGGDAGVQKKGKKGKKGKKLRKEMSKN